MSQYAKGAYYERQLKHKLEKEGWFVVRAAGSKGIIDLLAVRKGESMGIQVKKGKRLTLTERKALEELRKASGIKIFVVYFCGRQKVEWEEILPEMGGGGEGAPQDSPSG